MAPRRPWNRKKNPITAAAGAPVQGKSPVGLDALAKRSEQWQKRVLELVTAVPESSGAAALIYNTMDRIELKVEGKGIKKPDLYDFDINLANFDLGRAGMLLWLVGECFPAWTTDEFGETHWDVFSPTEFQMINGKPVKAIGPNDKWQELGPNTKVFRNWKASPANQFVAWSPHKGMIDLLEAMYVHQLADTAVGTSRLAGAGILYWPTDLPSLPMKDGRPEEGSREQLQEELQKAMMQSINDRNSSDAVVPLIVFGDPDLGQNLKPEHILLERPDDAKSFAERMNAYSQRYARGVELPIESVQGMGPANHWTAWVIKEDKWRFYISPIAELVANALLRNFVKPALAEMGYSSDVIRNATINVDGSKLIEKPDRSDAAIRLAQLGGFLSDEAVVRETGFDPINDIGDGARASAKTRLQELPAQLRDTTPMG